MIGTNISDLSNARSKNGKNTTNVQEIESRGKIGLKTQLCCSCKMHNCSAALLSITDESCLQPMRPATGNHKHCKQICQRQEKCSMSFLAALFPLEKAPHRFSCNWLWINRWLCETELLCILFWRYVSVCLTLCNAPLIFEHLNIWHKCSIVTHIYTGVLLHSTVSCDK